MAALIKVTKVWIVFIWKSSMKRSCRLRSSFKASQGGYVNNFFQNFFNKRSLCHRMRHSFSIKTTFEVVLESFSEKKIKGIDITPNKQRFTFNFKLENHASKWKRDKAPANKFNKSINICSLFIQPFDKLKASFKKKIKPFF